MSLTLIFAIIFIHWIADFVCQTHWQAVNKSTNNEALIAHTINYTVIFGVLTFWITVIYLAITKEEIKVSQSLVYWFLPTTFICHTITDYFTSRLNTRLWKKGDIHNFFVSVGFDQVLHYLQLFITFKLLT